MCNIWRECAEHTRHDGLGYIIHTNQDQASRPVTQGWQYLHSDMNDNKVYSKVVQQSSYVCQMDNMHHLGHRIYYINRLLYSHLVQSHHPVINIFTPREFSLFSRDR